MRREAVGLPISLDVEGKRALVVGGGDSALDKVERLLDARAIVTVVAREPGGGIASLAARSRITLFSRDFFPADAREADLVLACTHDAALVEKVAEAATGGAALWCEDDPARSDFAMPALVRAGRVRVAITTSGAAPALASKLRTALERDLDARFSAFVDRLAAERERLLRDEPDPAVRRAKLRALVEGFDVKLAFIWPEER